jgi:SAM-dependent methyltransferase
VDPEYYTTLDSIQERHWWYSARRTILERVLDRVFREGVPQGALYDLGCGVGANLQVLGRYGNAVGVDVSEQAVAFCHARGYANVRQSNLNRLDGIADGSGAVVVLADVIEHLDEEMPCLRAAHRALAPGGALIVTVPAYMFLWSPADDINHHKRRYTAQSLRRVIEPLFVVEHLTYFNTFLFGMVLAGRAVEKMMRRPGDDMAHVPSQPINDALRRVFASEARFVPRQRFPFGVSILCIARKARTEV